MASLLTQLKPKRRWMQVSLRTVLVLVTLLCVALGRWVALAERQRRAVAAIEAMGGSASYVDKRATGESFPMAFLRRHLPPDYFNKVYHVNLGWSQCNDMGLAHLQELAGLRRLWLGHAQVTDAGLARLQGLTTLRELDLSATQITDAGLVHLRGLTELRMLDLRCTQVTGAGMVHLQGLTRLQQLDFRHGQVTDAGLSCMHGLTSARYICLVGTQVTKEGATQLGKALPSCSLDGP